MEIKYYRKLSSSKDDNLRLQLATHVSLQVNLCRLCSASNIRLGWKSKIKGFSRLWCWLELSTNSTGISKHLQAPQLNHISVPNPSLIVCLWVSDSHMAILPDLRGISNHRRDTISTQPESVSGSHLRPCVKSFMAGQNTASVLKYLPKSECL